MSKLNFPKKDWRSNGKSFVKDRPWIRQGAELVQTQPKHRIHYYHCPVVHFKDAPKHVTDMVSSIYIK